MIHLEQNYRSTQNILAIASQVISYNKVRKDKKLWTENEAGSRANLYLAADERDEARHVVSEILSLVHKGQARYSDIAIFYRTNAQSRVFEDELLRNKIPYRIFGAMKFYERAEVKDILSYLKVLVNPQDSLGLKRILNVPARGLGKKAVEYLENFSVARAITLYETIGRAAEIFEITGTTRNRILQFHAMMERFRAEAFASSSLPLPDLLRKIIEESGYSEMLQKEKTVESEGRLENLEELLNVAQEFEKNTQGATPALFLEQVALVGQTDTFDPSQGTVSMMTLHLAKGLEFPAVFLVGMEEGLFPHSRSLEEIEEMEEERRLCYVGVTRARERLYLTHAVKRQLYGGDHYNLPSRFLDEMPQELIEKTEVQSRPKRFPERRDDDDLDQRHGFEDGSFEDSSASNGLKIGLTVQHPAFGVGVVKGREGHGERQKVTVYFNNGQVKTLVVKFANLSVVG